MKNYSVFPGTPLCDQRSVSSSRKNIILLGYKDSFIGKNQCPGNIKSNSIDKYAAIKM